MHGSGNTRVQKWSINSPPRDPSRWEETMSKFNYVPMKAIVPDAPVDEGLFSRYHFLAKAFLLQRDHMVAEGVQTKKRDPSLDIWKDIEPDNGAYRFEVAVRLPFFLPKLQGKDEYAVTVSGREYAVSNRHCEIVLANAKDNTYWLGHYLVTKEISRETGAVIVQWGVTKSLVLTQFAVEGSNASECVEQYFKDWLADLNTDIPNMIQSMRYHLPDRSYDLPDCNDIGRLCPVHALCIGGDSKVSNALTFVSHIDAYPMQAFTKLECSREQVEAFCSGATPVDYCKLILGKAFYLHHVGDHSLACVLACTACETLLTEWLHEELRGKGMGRNRDKDAFNDVRFSQLLNLLSYFLMDMRDADVKATVTAVNKIRKLRNDIIHENKSPGASDIVTVENGLSAVEELIQIRDSQPED